VERARASYRNGDVDDARDSAQRALAAAPDHPDVKIAAARIHLARLEYAESIRLLKGVDTTEARGLRGRAHWYADDLEAAADDLESLLSDPQAKDEWAKAIAKLARRGASRKPFQISGGLLAPIPMPRVRGTHLIVPLEIDGEQALALVATGKGEVFLDSATRKEPSWVQLRFGDRIEVRDVPALTEDLSGISKEVGAPIKALIGVNLLRRLNVTFDFGGEQFVVRTREPSPPPSSTRVGLAYAQGGAMVARVSFKQGGTDQHPVLINTLIPFPVALDEKGFKDAGVDPATLQPFPPDTHLKAGRLPFLRVGAFDVPDVPAFLGPSFADVQAATGMELNGAIGSGLLAAFRCTLTDGGRALWIEDVPPWVQQMMQAPPSGPPPEGGPPAGAPRGPGAAPPGAPPGAPPPPSEKGPLAPPKPAPKNPAQ
jgi:hypothetical protein